MKKIFIKRGLLSIGYTPYNEGTCSYKCGTLVIKQTNINTRQKKKTKNKTKKETTTKNKKTHKKQGKQVNQLKQIFDKTPQTVKTLNDYMESHFNFVPQVVGLSYIKWERIQKMGENTKKIS